MLPPYFDYCVKSVTKCQELYLGLFTDQLRMPNIQKCWSHSEENGRKTKKREKRFERKQTVRWKDNFRALPPE